MKKIISIVLIFCLMLTITACNGNNINTNPTTPADGNTQSQYYYEDENIALYDYRYMIFDFYEFKVSEADLQMYVNYYILLPNATYENVYEGQVEKEDYINISVKTTDINGKVIEQYTTGENGYFLYVGIGDFMPGLDRMVMQMKIGETKQFNQKMTIKGEEVLATIDITVNYAQLTHLPEATDELAEKAGYNSLEDFKKEYKEKLEAEYSADAYKIFLTIVKEKVIANIKNYPKELLDSYVKQYKDTAELYAVMEGMTLEEYLKKYSKMTLEEWEAQVAKEAEADVASELMLVAILKANNITLDNETYNHYLNKMAREMNYASGKLLELEMEQQGLKAELVREITMNYAYDVFLLTAKLRLVDWITGDVIVDYVEKP